MIKKSEENIDIICDYIDTKISLRKTPEENYQQVYSIKKIFENTCIDYNIELFLHLFEKSKKLNRIIENIIENNLIEENDDFIQLLFEAYIKAKHNQITKRNIEENMRREDLDTLNLYFKEIANIPVLDSVQEKKLTQLMKNGDEEARRIIIECNLKLVISIAKNYINNGLSLQDLIQEGNIGLIVATQKFDSSKNVRFSTYATYWIHQKINLAISNTANTIRISRYITIEKKKLIKLIDELSKQLKRKPTTSEISNHLNIPEERIKELLKIDCQVVSLSSLLPDNDREKLSDFIPYESESVEDTVIKNDLIHYIRSISFESDILTERQKYVLSKRFGYNCKETSLEDIGKELNISSEAVRQIVVNSIIKILKFKGYEMSKYLKNPDEIIRIVNQINENPKSFKLKKIKIPTNKVKK